MRAPARNGGALERHGRQVCVLHERAGARYPLLEMHGRHIGWKCAHLHGVKVFWRGMGGRFVFCTCAQVQGAPRWGCVGGRFAEVRAPRVRGVSGGGGLAGRGNPQAAGLLVGGTHRRRKYVGNLQAAGHQVEEPAGGGGGRKGKKPPAGLQSCGKMYIFGKIGCPEVII